MVIRKLWDNLEEQTGILVNRVFPILYQIRQIGRIKLYL